MLAEALFGTGTIPRVDCLELHNIFMFKAGYFGNNRCATAFVSLVAAKMLVKETNTAEEFLSLFFMKRSFDFNHPNK